MMITGEYKVKKAKERQCSRVYLLPLHQENQNLKCPEPCIRQEELDRQLSSLIQKFSLRPDWAEGNA